MIADASERAAAFEALLDVIAEELVEHYLAEIADVQEQVRNDWDTLIGGRPR